MALITIKAWVRGHATPDPRGMEPATPEIRNRRDRWLREGATPGRCETQKATLPDRLCWYRENRWLRGHATSDSCDWWSELFRSSLPSRRLNWARVMPRITLSPKVALARID